ncbi:MAG: M23 family metallopeptidase [Vampirovibrio sp.]
MIVTSALALGHPSSAMPIPQRPAMLSPTGNSALDSILGEAQALTQGMEATAQSLERQTQEAAQLKQQRDALNQNQAMWLASMKTSPLMANGASGGKMVASSPASMRSAALPASEPFVPSEVDQTKEIINGAYAEGQGIISQALAAGGGGTSTAMSNTVANPVPAPQITAMTSPIPSIPSVVPANGVPASGTGGFIHPLQGSKWTKTSDFSHSRVNPVTGKMRPHTGVDFGADAGTAIVAAKSGIVSFSNVKGGYGNCIEIKHDDGTETLYGHMLEPSPLKEGQVVVQGTQIGKVGSTGNSTGNHLHFEIKQGGVAVNPMNHLDQNASKENGTTVAQGSAKSKGKSKST